MKYLYTLFFIFVVWLQLQAQTVMVSEPLTVRSETFYDVIGNLNDNILIFRNENSNCEVQCFDKQLQIAWEKELITDKKQIKLLGVLSTLEDFTFFYHYRQKGNIIVKAQKYDAGVNMVDSTTVISLGKLLHTPNLSFVYSDDKSKVLIYYFKDDNQVTAYCYDSQSMKLLWDKVINSDKLSLNRDFQQILVDNKGNMHLVMEKNNKKSKIEEHHYEIFEYGERLDFSLHRYMIDMQEKLTYDVFFKYDDLNQRLLAGGLFLHENGVWAGGYFYLKIPTSQPEDHLLQFHSFEDDFVAILREKDKDKAKKNRGIPEAMVQEIVLRSDGGMILIGELSREVERNQSTTVGYYGSPNTVGMMDYYLDDIFVISIHPNGKEHWKTILHKKQYSQDDGAAYSSYFLLKTAKALRLIFNDEIKPENTVSEYVLGGNGKYDRNSLLSTENQKLRLRFREGIQIASNALLVPSESRNELKLVRITY